MNHSEPIGTPRIHCRPALASTRNALRSGVLASLLLLTTACASVELPPEQELQAADLAISNAEQERVADYASPELNQARTKLTAARTAVEGEDMKLARRLADEARVSAELASAKTEVLKAEAINTEMRQSITTLKQEMQRNSGTVQ